MSDDVELDEHDVVLYRFASPDDGPCGAGSLGALSCTTDGSCQNIVGGGSDVEAGAVFTLWLDVDQDDWQEFDDAEPLAGASADVDLAFYCDALSQHLRPDDHDPRGTATYRRGTRMIVQLDLP